jgi:hypothetical protein
MKSGSGKYFLLISVSLIGAVILSLNKLPHDALGQGPSVVKEQVSNTLNTSDISTKLQNYENLTSFFGSPIYQETSHKKVGSVTVNTDPMQTQDSFNATGILNGVGNITDLGTFVTTHLDKSNSTSIGKGNFTTIDGEIANYTGHDVGKTDDNGIETYKGIQIFESNPEGRLGFLDNVIGLYVYKYWPNGTASGIIWDWK